MRKKLFQQIVFKFTRVKVSHTNLHKFCRPNLYNWGRSLCTEIESRMIAASLASSEPIIQFEILILNAFIELGCFFVFHFVTNTILHKHAYISERSKARIDFSNYQAKLASFIYFVSS